MIVFFMGGWKRYCLQNNYSTDILKGSLARIKSAIKAYQNFTLKKDKEMEKIIALDKKEELEDWIKSKLEKKF